MSGPLTLGQTFAQRYRVVAFLAQGGFGAVYVAEQLETELRVALKVLLPHVLASGDAAERFKLEARVSSRVNSEHIVTVFDAGYDDVTQMAFLVMELLSGETIEEAVARGGPLPAHDVATYFGQIASALDKAHRYVDKGGGRRPIIHRDLKPDNLFLALRESGRPIVKILDFGIAKVLGESAQLSQDLKGTPLYMAFEQIAGETISPQTDIWALGLIAFYMLTGKRYWKSTGLSGGLPQLFAEVLSMPLCSASTRSWELGGPTLSAGFDAWFSRCVHRDPSQRFASAGDCAHHLSLSLGASGIGSKPTLLSATVVESRPHPTREVSSLPRAAKAPTQSLQDTAGAGAVGRTHRSPTRTPSRYLPALAGATLALGAASWFVSREHASVATGSAHGTRPPSATAGQASAPSLPSGPAPTPSLEPARSSSPPPARALKSATRPRVDPSTTERAPYPATGEDVYGDR